MYSGTQPIIIPRLYSFVLTVIGILVYRLVIFNMVCTFIYLICVIYVAFYIVNIVLLCSNISKFIELITLNSNKIVSG